MRQESRIIQIIPADGWFAYYKQDDGTLEKSKIVCLALYDDGGIHFMDADGSGWIEESCGTSNFSHVEYEGEDGKR